MNPIKQAIQELTKSNGEFYSVLAKVDAVDKSNGTCDVTPIIGDAEIFDVRLQALPGETDHFMVIPKVGSQVVVSFISKELAFVSMTSEVVSFEIKYQGQILHYDSQGFKLESASANLKDTLDGLADAINGLLTTLKTFMVMTPQGPSTNVMPQTIADLESKRLKIEEFKTKLSTILK